MRKFLFISFTSEQTYTGGQLCSKRNLKSLEELLGTDNVVSYIIKPYKNKKSIVSILKRIRDLFFFYMGGMDKRKENEILNLIESSKLTDVFLDSSLLGKLAGKIKQTFPEVSIYTFFHNNEFLFCKSYVLVNHDYIRFYWPLLSYLNEKMACLYSDKIIALNYRDYEDIARMYKRTPEFIVPITINNTYNNHYSKKFASNNTKQALFVGSYFYGNVQGIKWFCERVLPLVNIELIIVGSGMDKLKKELVMTEKIKIFSDVPNLSIFYESADFVVLPILSGSGMKVKTAEALMYGKFIIGSKEALTGYDVTENIATECNSENDFITAISNFNLNNRYNRESRLLYEEKYSYNSSLDIFSKIIKKE